MELWDLYTENRELTGKTHIRGEKIPNGFFHLVVHIWIKNSKGRWLISQRAADRPTFPLKWECVGGSVLKGETSLQGAIREVKEEVGIDLSPESGKLLFSRVRKTVDGKPFNDIMEVWLFEYDGEVNLKNALSAEVKTTKWVTAEEFKALFDKGNSVDTLSYFFTDVARKF